MVVSVLKQQGTTEMQYRIKNECWEVIYQHLKKEKGKHVKNQEKVRIFYEAVWYMARSGCQWRLLPTCYGNWRAVHRRFFRWVKLGVWERLLDSMKASPDLESVMIDGTIIRAHSCAAGYRKDSQKEEALGRCVGGFSSKRPGVYVGPIESVT